MKAVFALKKLSWQYTYSKLLAQGRPVRVLHDA